VIWILLFLQQFAQICYWTIPCVRLLRCRKRNWLDSISIILESLWYNAAPVQQHAYDHRLFNEIKLVFWRNIIFVKMNINLSCVCSSRSITQQQHKNNSAINSNCWKIITKRIERSWSCFAPRSSMKTLLLLTFVGRQPWCCSMWGAQKAARLSQGK